MNRLKLNEYQKISKRTLPERGNLLEKKWALANYSLGLVEESGECGGHIKKHAFHGHELNVEEVKNELGDVLHYAAGLATMCGLSLESIANGNIAKLQRRYPKGFSREASIERVDIKN